MGSRSKKQQQEQESSGSGSNADEAEFPDAILNGITFATNNVKKFIHETLPKCSTDEGKHAMAGRMEKLLLRLVKAEMTYKRAEGIVEEVVEEMPDDADSDASAILKACDDIADISTRRITSFEKGLKEEDLKKNKTYTQLMKDMAIQLAAKPTATEEDDDDDSDEEDEEGDEGDEEVEEDSDEVQDDEEDLIPISDPVTKQHLEDPVRNKKCGHIYEKASIRHLMKQSTKTRCPIPGCSNKDFIRVAHLEVDKKLTDAVKKRQSEAKRSKRR